MEKRIELERRARKADQITELILDNCRSTSIVGLTNEYTALETLSLINVGLTTLKGFPVLPNLKRLELSDNRISSGLDYLVECDKIQYLNLSGNKIQKLEELKPLQELKTLVSLDLFNNEATKAKDYREQVFAMIPTLKYLDGFDRNDEEANVEDDDEANGNGSDEDDSGSDDDEDGDDDDGSDEVLLSEIYNEDNMEEYYSEWDGEDQGEEYDDEIESDDDDDVESDEEQGVSPAKKSLTEKGGKAGAKDSTATANNASANESSSSSKVPSKSAGEDLKENSNANSTEVEATTNNDDDDAQARGKKRKHDD